MTFGGLHCIALEKVHKPGVVVHTCNPALWRLKQEDREWQANLGYIARPCLKKKKKKKKQHREPTLGCG
jgi:hypothetical protein